MPRFRLQRATYEKPDGIDAECFLVDPSQTEKMDVLVVAFSGVCPDGSRGNPHGRYVSYVTMCALHAFGPECLVLDFRDLEYRWGNSMLGVFQDVSQFMDAGLREGEAPFPVLVVTSGRSSGFASLLRAPRPGERDFRFDDLDRAIEAAIAAAQYWLDN